MDKDSIEKVTIAIHKISAQPGDLVVVNFPDDTPMEQIEEFGADLKEYVLEDVTILCSRKEMNIENIPEHKMNEMGWYKFDNNKEKAN